MTEKKYIVERRGNIKIIRDMENLEKFRKELLDKIPSELVEQVTITITKYYD